MDVARFIQIYIVQGLIGLFYLYMSYVILRRDKKNLHLALCGFYVCVGLGVIINIIYASFFDEALVYLLHFLTYFLLCFCQVFLLIFVLILTKSKNIINLKVQLVLIITFGILLCGLWFIPNGITINETTNWKPVWSREFLIYSYAVCTLFTFGPLIYYSTKIYLKLESLYLKRKWLFFIIGLLSYYFLYYGTSLSNSLNDSGFRLIWSIISLFVIPSTYLIYYGVGREL
ncbi:MAG: hypothetical protein ACFFDK_09140 [Promethearchaeota archaeon]